MFTQKLRKIAGQFSWLRYWNYKSDFPQIWNNVNISGHVGWGIAWYINGLLIPEINVVRGKTYTFVVEGGLDPEVPAKYHPLYITDDPVGGYEYKTPEERRVRKKSLQGIQWVLSWTL